MMISISCFIIRRMNPLSFFKCLSDQTRLTCLMLLQQEGELCVCELMEALQESQPKISRHLAQLRKFDLLSDRRQGQWVFYSINPSLASWAKRVLEETLLSNESQIQDCLNNLALMRSRPNRQQTCC